MLFVLNYVIKLSVGFVSFMYLTNKLEEDEDEE